MTRAPWNTRAWQPCAFVSSPIDSPLAHAAAREAAARIRAAIAARGQARIVAATGTSQVAFLDQLTPQTDLDWSGVELFHLDEYIGLPEDHPASFRRYLRKRLIQPVGIVRFHLIDGHGDPDDALRRARGVQAAVKGERVVGRWLIN
ncbi:MAG: 6-phosphogluconolactonase [Vicinamibacterales bacterium]